MSKKACLLTREDVPKYIKEIVSHLQPVSGGEYADHPEYEVGYTFRLYGKYKRGYENMITNDCEKLIKWANSWYADARVIEEHFWEKDCAVYSHGVYDYTRTMNAADRAHFRNYYVIVITDPVAHRFEKDGFYREEKL